MDQEEDNDLARSLFAENLRAVAELASLLAVAGWERVVIESDRPSGIACVRAEQARGFPSRAALVFEACGDGRTRYRYQSGIAGQRGHWVSTTSADAMKWARRTFAP